MRKMPVRVDEHVDAAVALDGGGDERLGLLARGDLAGVDVRRARRSGRARRARPRAWPGGCR